MSANPKIVIVNYGLGNLFSVENKLKKTGYSSIISSDKKEILEADYLILPGVGHFKTAMQNLHQSGLTDVLNETVTIKKKPILGICLGMQLMCKKSEEGNVEGIAWLDAEVYKLKNTGASNLKIPHMGWNTLSSIPQHQLMNDIKSNDEFFFQHSYAAQISNPDLTHTITEYLQPFCSILIKDNILGVQFHPEKSFEAGAKIFRNFINNF